MLHFLKKPLAIGLTAVIILGVGGYFIFKKGGGKPFESVMAVRRDLVQEISVTGTVTPAQRIDLAFERNGKIARIAVEVGTRVHANDLLATLNQASLFAELQQAEAGVAIQTAKLEALQSGARPEELEVEQARVHSVETSRDEASQNFVLALKDAYTRADDAIHNKADQLINNSRSSNPQINFTTDQELKTKIEKDRQTLEGVLEQLRIKTDSLVPNNTLTDTAHDIALTLNEIAAFLANISLAITSITPNVGLTQTTIDGWKTSISSARTSLNTARINLASNEGKFESATSDLAVAERQLALKKAGATVNDLRAQEATLEEAKANADHLRAELATATLRAPIDGIITEKNGEVGALATAQKPIISLISTSAQEIEANVAETDIAKIAPGMHAKVTLDAYGNEPVFDTIVTSVDPAETIIDGVVTYKTKFSFTSSDDRVRSGMTANVDVETGRREQIIAIPERALITKDDGIYVRVVQSSPAEKNPSNTSSQKNKQIAKEIKVSTGLRGSDGFIEITAGIKEGDEIITSLNE